MAKRKSTPMAKAVVTPPKRTQMQMTSMPPAAPIPMMAAQKVQNKMAKMKTSSWQKAQMKAGLVPSS